VDPAPLRVDDGGVVWRSTWRAVYAVFRRADWFTRALVALRVPTYADAIVELGLVGRRTGLPRPVLVGLLRIDDRLYVGHPSGSTPWLANLAAADAVTLRARNRPQLRVHSTPLVLGLERDAAIRAAARQEPLPMRPIFWASRRHSLRAGVYHRLDVIVDPTAA
jgi:hypothetical protein